MATTDRITTAMDRNSDTILFQGDTPSDAYEALTDAVYSARYHPDFVQINIENLPRDTVIGKATYDESTGKVTELHLERWLLEDEDYAVPK